MPTAQDARAAAQAAAAQQAQVPAVADPAAPPELQSVNQLLVTDRIQQALERALDGVISTDRFASLVMTVMRSNRTLATCEPMSIIAAAVQAAQLGLEPGPMEEAYVVPFKDNRDGGIWKAQLIVGYKGLVQLAHRAGVAVRARTVYENDDFDFGEGTGAHEFLRHRRTFSDRGEVLCYYSLAKWFVDGQEQSIFHIMTPAEVQTIREKYSKAKDAGPWVNNFEGMAWKTTVRAGARWMPKAVQLQRALAADETVRSSLDDIKPGMADQAWVDREHEFAAERRAAALPVQAKEGDAPAEAPTGKCPTCNFDLPEHADQCPEDGG